MSSRNPQQILHDTSASDAYGTADRLRDAALAADDPARAIAELASAAGDPDLQPRTRAIALYATALAAVMADMPLPVDAIAAVEDPLVADWALAHDIIPALTGALALAPKEDASLNATRRLFGRMLLARSERGPHITQLLLDGGDLEAAARAAAEDFVESVQPLAGDPARDSALPAAWASIALDWHTDDRHGMFARFCAELRKHDGAPEALVALLRRLPNAGPAAVATACDAILNQGETS